MSSTNIDNEDLEVAAAYTQEDAGSTTFLCFGVCDMRIATLAANGFNIAATLVGILVAGFKSYLFWKALGGALAAGIPGLALSAVGIYGAKEFDLRAMYAASAGFGLLLLIDICMFQWVGILINLLVVFPQTVFTFELSNGFLTKENYAEQEYMSEQGRDFVDRVHSQYIAPMAVSPTSSAQ